MRVLLVEDERKLAHRVAQGLREQAFAVDLAHDGRRGLEMAQEYDYDAVVLDLMLPGLDGMAVCRRLREAGRTTPILVLSARNMVDDRVRGLEVGADDYLVKPFAMAELVARLRALQRRRERGGAPLLSVGPLDLDLSTRTARREGRNIPLTQKEFALLEYFMQRRGLVLTRSMIADHVWDESFEQASNVVDVYIKRLRDKIDEPGRPSLIQTVRGAGYVFRGPDDAAA